MAGITSGTILHCEMDEAGVHAAQASAARALPRLLWRRLCASPMTLVLVGLNVLMDAIFRTGPGTHSYVDTGAINLLHAIDGEWWKLFLFPWLHLNGQHLMWNMVWLFAMGVLLEPLLGSRRFLLAYGASLLGAWIAALLFDVVGIGASGAIYGLMGMGLAVLAGLRPWRYSLAWILIAWKVCSGLVDYREDLDVGQVAHLGGLVAGILVGLKFRSRVPDSGVLLPYQKLLAASVALILLVIVLGDTRWAPAAHATLARIEEKRGMKDESFRHWMQTGEMANARRAIEVRLIKEAAICVSHSGRCYPAAVEMLERVPAELMETRDYRLLGYLQTRGPARDDQAARANLVAAMEHDPGDLLTVSALSGLHATSSDPLVRNPRLAIRYAWRAADLESAPSDISAKALAMAYRAAGEDSVAVVLMRLAVQLSEDRYRAGYEAELAAMVERLRAAEAAEAEPAGPANRPAIVSTAALPPTDHPRSGR